MVMNDGLANRIVLGIIAATLFNGLVVLMSVHHPAGWQQVKRRQDQCS